MLGGTIAKEVGQNYTVEWNREKFTVTVIFKGKPKKTFLFDKFYKSVNFYASLKKVKDVKECLLE